MDALTRLREVHRNGEQVGASAYANLVREAFRIAPSITRELLQETYEEGLEEAYSTRGSGALAKVAQMGSEQLNAVGDHAGALARLNQALQMAGADRGAQAQILAARAGWEVFSEQPSVAQLTLAQAAEVLPPDADAETVIGVDAVSATVALVLLQPGAIDSATDAISRARSNEFDSMASGLMVFLIAALGSSEDAPQAAAWADALHGYAASLPHPAREVDAAVAQVALRGRRHLEAPPIELDEAADRTFNNYASWRLRTARLYTQITLDDSVGAAESSAALSAMRAEINSGYAVAADGFAAAVQAQFGAGAVTNVGAPRSEPTLLMIAGALASAEATAVAGSQSAAADWLHWFETRLPASVTSSLEWPSCRQRVEGLLLLRLGREREAITRLQAAIGCCDARGDAIQAAIGRVQLSEALLRGSTASMIPMTHARTLQQTGADQLRRLGVAPVPFAYAASQTFLREEQMPERGGLTPREAQVLGRLANGMTYREIGADLGINSRTVGVHASHCYEKLGVRNRVEAVKLAQELGVV